LNNTQIPQVNEVMNLGVYLDRRLTWRKHIERKKVPLKLKAAASTGLLTLIRPWASDIR